MARHAKAKRETSAGGIVFRCTDEGPRVLLINDGHQNWGFPKGHLDDGEQAVDAARREVQEETGLQDLSPHEPLGTIDWFFRLRGALIHKYCHFFLFESRAGTPTPQIEEGITQCRWCSVAEALEMVSYQNTRTILRRAGDFVRDHCPQGGRDVSG